MNEVLSIIKTNGENGEDKETTVTGNNFTNYDFLYLDDNTPVIEYALSYIKAGWKIVPTYWNSKENELRPTMKWGTEWIEDEETIKQYWTKNPYAGIAVLTGEKSGITVFDTDQHDYNGFITRTSLENDLGKLPDTLTVLTPNDGEHQYFKYVASVDSKAGESAFGTGNYGMDIRNDGGLIHLPPTKKLVNGTWIPYRWDTGCETIAELPEAWKQHISNVSNPSNTRTTGGKFKLPEMIKTGMRNETLFKYVCSQRGKGVHTLDIWQSLQIINSERCKPPLKDKELQDLFNSATSKKYDDTNASSLAETTPPEPGVNGGNLPAINRWNFHRIKQDGTAGDILDDAIEKDIIIRNNIFLLNGKLYVYEDGYYKFDEDDIIIKDIVKQYIFPDWIKADRLERVVKLLKSELKIKVTEQEINNFPDHWICFKNGFLDLKTMKLYRHDPKYRNTYQIPHEWKPNHNPAGSVTEAYLKDFFKDSDDLEMFLEFTGYSMTKNMDAQKMLILTGEGGIGKSVLLRMIEKLIGIENISGLTLQNLNDRFSPASLQNKLLNVYADIPSEAMKDTAGMKTITGQDRVRGEYKGGKVFFFKPFCKCIFSANIIPCAEDDDTSAFYRRLLIIRFTERAGYIPDLEKKLRQDTQSFISLAVMAAHRMYERGTILESENSKNAVLDLQMSADSVASFIHDRCKTGRECRIATTKIYDHFCEYCKSEERRSMSNQKFYNSLIRKGYVKVTLNGTDTFNGIGLKE